MALYYYGDETLVCCSMSFMFNGYLLLLILVFINSLKCKTLQINKLTISEKKKAQSFWTVVSVVLTTGCTHCSFPLQRCYNYKWQSVERFCLINFPLSIPFSSATQNNLKDLGEMQPEVIPSKRPVPVLQPVKTVHNVLKDNWKKQFQRQNERMHPCQDEIIYLILNYLLV